MPGQNLNTVTITAPGEDPISPELVEGYKYKRATGNTSTDTLDGDPVLMFSPGGLRRGELTCIIADAAAAHTLAGLFADVKDVFTLADSIQPAADMSFAPLDDVELEQDSTRLIWRVTVGFQEVPA